MRVVTGHRTAQPVAGEWDSARMERRFGPPRPGFDHAGIDISTGPRPVIGERSYSPPLPTARDHGDDDLAADKPMSSAAWLALLVAVAIAVIATTLLVKL